jgi:hypothetical protein
MDHAMNPLTPAIVLTVIASTLQLMLVAFYLMEYVR